MRIPSSLQLRFIAYATLAILALGALFSTAIIIFVREQSAPYRVTSYEATPVKRVGMVFGAGVRPDGSLSAMLQDRVLAAIALYNQGKISKILMTGDNSSIDYNEVEAMKRFAIAQGIPEQDITLDYAGLNTYDSCWRAHKLFGVQEAVLLTQRFHQPRAVFLCRTLGIDAVGLDLLDFEIYPNTRLPYVSREFLATIKAWWQVTIQK